MATLSNLPTELRQFKSSGTYRLEKDQSQLINIPNVTMRLVIGFSKTGPFNTPVFIQDPQTFKEIYGDIDRPLERKGSWFHRSCLISLQKGPIIVLNLLALTDSDTTEFRTLSTAVDANNSTIKSAPLEDNYNREKFWRLDSAELLNSITAVQGNYGILNFSNVGRRTLSVLVKKTKVSGYDITADEWYGSGSVPDFMDGKDWISDYMVDIYVVEGDFSNHSELRLDPVFGDFFTLSGLQKTYIDKFGTSRDGLDDFIQLDGVKVLGYYTGSLIPDFVDKDGNELFIEDIVNLNSAVTGLLCAVDQDKFDDEFVSGDDVDLVGHSIHSENVNQVDFLSYYGDISGTKTWTEVDILDTALGVTGATSAIGATTTFGTLIATTGLTTAAGYTAADHFNAITLYSPASTVVTGGSASSIWGSTAAYASFIESLDVGMAYVQVSIAGATAGLYTYAKTASIDTSISNQVTLQINLQDQAQVLDGDASFMYIAAGAVNVLVDVDFTNENDDVIGGDFVLYAGEGSLLYEDYSAGLVGTGDQFLHTGPGYKYVQFKRATFTDSSTVDATYSAIFSHEVNYISVTMFTDNTFAAAYTPGFDTGATDFTAQMTAGAITADFTIAEVIDSNQVTIDNSGGTVTGNLLVGQFLLSTNNDVRTGKSRLARITKISEDTLTGLMTVTTLGDIFVTGMTITRYDEVDEFIPYYRFSVLDGFTMLATHMPNNTNTRMNEILDVMYNSNIRTALIDRELITWRYLIDTFNHGIEPNSKGRLSRLCKDRQSAFAILNAPSIKEFKESTNPLFKFDTTSSFDTRYLALGGNLDLNPSNVYALPNIDNGANYCGFYGPNILVREANAILSVPQAAYVGNNYIDKHNQALPYSIIAGPRRGIISGTGVVDVEYPFDRTDLDNLEPFGYNATIRKKGYGLVINSNSTAQQTPKSALSQIHVRELLITIEDGVEAILADYQWEFNTPQARLEIKTLADAFLAQIRNDGGLSDFENVMDLSNNTPAIIDNNFGILDTYVEPVRGLGILVHRITILATGQLSSQSF